MYQDSSRSGSSELPCSTVGADCSTPLGNGEETRRKPRLIFEMLPMPQASSFPVHMAAHALSSGTQYASHACVHTSITSTISSRPTGLDDGREGARPKGEPDEYAAMIAKCPISNTWRVISNQCVRQRRANTARAASDKQNSQGQAGVEQGVLRLRLAHVQRERRKQSAHAREYRAQASLGNVSHVHVGDDD